MNRSIDSTELRNACLQIAIQRQVNRGKDWLAARERPVPKNGRKVIGVSVQPRNPVSFRPFGLTR